MRKSTIYLYLLGIAVVITTALVSAGLIVSAQNSNSSTTMQADNMSTAKPKPKSRRHKMKPKPTEAATDAGMAAEAMQPATPRRTGRCDPMQQEQTDLSGTYTGRLRHGDEEVRDATLTITGNNFTMTSGSDTHSGRIAAVTTCGYTAVTVMHVGDMAGAAPGATPAPNRAMSLRAKKMGDSLTLTSVPGEPERVMFTSGGGAMRPRKHRTRKPAPPPPPTTPPE